MPGLFSVGRAPGWRLTWPAPAQYVDIAPGTDQAPSRPASSGSSRRQYEQPGSLKTAIRRRPVPRTVLIAGIA